MDQEMEDFKAGADKAIADINALPTPSAPPRGFIEVTLFGTENKYLVNTQSINVVRAVAEVQDESPAYTIIVLTSTPYGGVPVTVPYELEVSEQYDQVRAMLVKTQG